MRLKRQILLALVLASLSLACVPVGTGSGEDGYTHGMPYPKIFVHGIAGGCVDADHLFSQVTRGRTDYGCHNSASIESYANSSLPADSFWRFEYYYNESGTAYDAAPIGEYARRLENFITKVKAKTGARKVILIAHSQGGLVVRRYMANSFANWQTVYRFVTLGTPNLGVYGVLGLGTGGACGGFLSAIDAITLGLFNLIDEECVDLDDSSDFMHRLSDDWQLMKEYYLDSSEGQNRKWGIVAGVSPRYSKATNDPTQIDGQSALQLTSGIAPTGESWLYTVNGNFGLVELWSAIPGEWLMAARDAFGVSERNTPNYGFRMIYEATHSELLQKNESIEALDWADSDENWDEPNTPGFTIYRQYDFNYHLIERDYRNNYPLTFTGDVDDLYGLLADSWGDSWDERTLFDSQVSSVFVDAWGLDITFYDYPYQQGGYFSFFDSVSYLWNHFFDERVSSIQTQVIDDNANGIPDYQEYLISLNPSSIGSVADTNGDGIPDINPASVDDPLMQPVPLYPGMIHDIDADGMSDPDEIANGSDPHDALDVACLVPNSSDWVVTATCTLHQDQTFSGDVTVQSGAVLKIAPGVILDLDFAGHALRVQQGGGVLIKNGASLR